MVHHFQLKNFVQLGGFAVPPKEIVALQIENVTFQVAIVMWLMRIVA